MTLGEMIDTLAALPQGMALRPGLGRPCSWRGSYSELAFCRTEQATVADVLAEARGAVGATYTGWKGGEFTMGFASDVYVVPEPRELGTPLTAEWFAVQATVAERDQLRARCERLEAALRKRGHAQDCYASFNRRVRRAMAEIGVGLSDAAELVREDKTPPPGCTCGLDAALECT